MACPDGRTYALKFVKFREVNSKKETTVQNAKERLIHEHKIHKIQEVPTLVVTLNKRPGLLLPLGDPVDFNDPASRESVVSACNYFVVEKRLVHKDMKRARNVVANTEMIILD